MSKNTLTLEEQSNVIISYLKGASPLDLGKEYNVTTNTIKDVVENRELRTVVEKKHVELTQAKEARRIDDIKDQILTFISQSLQEATESEDRKILFLDKVSKMITDLDRISRLNREQVTSNDVVTNKNVKIDVAAIISQLKTPDDKRAFLRQQLVVENIEDSN